MAVAVGVFFLAGGPGLWARRMTRLNAPSFRPAFGGGAATGAPHRRLHAGRCLRGQGAADSPILVDYFGNLRRLPMLLRHGLRDSAGFARLWRTQTGTLTNNPAGNFAAVPSNRRSRRAFLQQPHGAPPRVSQAKSATPQL